MDRSGLNLLYISRGFTTHDQRFLQSFITAGYRVSYLRWLGNSANTDVRPIPDGVRVLTWVSDQGGASTILDYFVRYRALRRILREVRPQVVLAGPVQTSAFLTALTGYTRLVTMSWGTDILVDANRNIWARVITQYALRHSAGVFGDCRAVRDKILAFAHIPDDYIVTFPWGIDLASFSPGGSALRLRQELGWTNNPILISTRTWEPLYGIDVLVRAFSTVRDRHPAARLILLGDGSQGPAIRRLITQLGLTEYVYAPGYVSHDLLPDYFRLADVYISSARSDGTSISLLEAMACGLPVVVTNGHGNLEWVTHGQNGWLVTAGDSNALAVAVNEALTNPAQLAAMNQANTALVRDRANWNMNFPQLLHLFQRVAQQSRLQSGHSPDGG